MSDAASVETGVAGEQAAAELMTFHTAPVAPPSPYGMYVLFVLFLIYVSNFADRQVVAILAQNIKADLHLRDWQVGLLTGPAIAAFYAVLGIPMAYVADRVHRVRLLAICLVVWSAFTACGGLARNLVQLAMTRVGVSIAEAGGTPTSASLIGDIFPATQRATALGLYSSATPVGVLVGFALGGLIADHFGWRGAIVAAGLPGAVLVILLLLTVREPVRGIRDAPIATDELAANKLSLWQVIRKLAAIRPYRRMVLASAGPNVTVYVLLSWAPAFAMRTFHVSAGKIGPLIGLGFSVLGAIAIIGGGVITDRLNRKSRQTAVRLTGVIQLLVVPLLVLALFAGSFWTFIVAASLAYGAASFFASPNWALTQNAAPPQMRASAAALMLLVFNAVGLGVGPPLVGAVSDLLVGHFGTESLKYALLIPALFSGVAGLMFFWVAACLPGAAETDPARP